MYIFKVVFFHYMHNAYIYDFWMHQVARVYLSVCECYVIRRASYNEVDPIVHNRDGRDGIRKAEVVDATLVPALQREGLGQEHTEVRAAPGRSIPAINENLPHLY